MPDSSPSLLHKIYRLGERMREALRADRMESFAALAAERTMLVNRLRTYDHPSQVSSDWMRWAERLTAQQQQLTAAINTRTSRMTETIGELERFKQANQKYGDASSNSDRALNRPLRV